MRMIIFKSDNIDNWNELMLSDTCGTKMMRTNPRTGETELAYELNRQPVELLKDANMTGLEMFDFIYELQDTYSKMDDVYNSLSIKYNWSKIEAQNLIKYLHLALPKNEKNHSILLTSWKKWRNKETVREEFLNAPKELPVYDDAHYLAKSIMRGGKLHIGSFLDAAIYEISKLTMTVPEENEH